MERCWPILLVALAALAACEARIPAAEAPELVRVAPPTGTERDRDAILDALDSVPPGGTVQFEEGLYLVGEIVVVETPGITLQGHPDGTTLRGCELERFARMEEEMGRVMETVQAALASGSVPDPDDLEAAEAIVRGCGLFELHGGGIAVRGFTVDQSRSGICLNTCSGADAPVEPGWEHGGYLVERNVFRESANGVRGRLLSDDRSIIRTNTFINTYHAVSMGGRNVHVVDNEITAPEPARVPESGLVSFAIAFGGEDHLIAGNRIGGHPEGILMATLPGEVARGNTIRDNRITVARVAVPSEGAALLPMSNAEDSTFAGVPIAFAYVAIRLPGSDPDEELQPGHFVENSIEDNEIHGAEGVGIHIENGVGNRIRGNTIRGVVARVPYPGNTLGSSPAWPRANGAGIWLSPGSTGNEVTDNVFVDVRGPVVAIEGDGNRVTVEADARVLDLGEGNTTSRASSGR
ncbi:MAG TPA: right-handed parallel beta-helix repeat-containing protein [Longimicrobiales bacterium]|nr:right-handed parallel beta-helix repeat-containing protein [Longimicrobiales bacterium]